VSIPTKFKRITYVWLRAGKIRALVQKWGALREWCGFGKGKDGQGVDQWDNGEQLGGFGRVGGAHVWNKKRGVGSPHTFLDVTSWTKMETFETVKEEESLPSDEKKKKNG